MATQHIVNSNSKGGAGMGWLQSMLQKAQSVKEENMCCNWYFCRWPAKNAQIPPKKRQTKRNSAQMVIFSYLENQGSDFFLMSQHGCGILFLLRQLWGVWSRAIQVQFGVNTGKTIDCQDVFWDGGAYGKSLPFWINVSSLRKDQVYCLVSIYLRKGG